MSCDTYDYSNYRYDGICKPSNITGEPHIAVKLELQTNAMGWEL